MQKLPRRNDLAKQNLEDKNITKNKQIKLVEIF